MTLRWRLTFAFVLVVVVPLVVGAAIVMRALPHEVQAGQREAAQTSSRLVAQVVRDYCDRARAAAEAAARTATVGTPAAARSAVGSLVDRGLADGIRVTAPSGRVVAESGALPSTVTDCASASTGG